MRLDVHVVPVEEPVREVTDALEAVLVILLGLGPVKARLRGVVPDVPGREVEPLGHPAVELLVALEVLAGPAHRFLEAAEGCLVPLRTVQAENEGLLVSLELPAQQIQMLVHGLIVQDRVPNWRGYPRTSS